MKVQATTRLKAARTRDDIEKEVLQNPRYLKAVKLAEKAVDLHGKIKIALGGFDLTDRPIAKELLEDETGLNAKLI